MVALLFSHRCVHSLENPGTWNAFASDGRRDFPLRETRNNGPRTLGAKSKTELGDGKPLRQMRVNRSGLVRRISRLIRRMRAPLAGPLANLEDRGFVPLRAGQVLIGVLDYSRRTNARHRNLFSLSAAGQRGRHVG